VSDGTGERPCTVAVSSAGLEAVRRLQAEDRWPGTASVVLLDGPSPDGGLRAVDVLWRRQSDRTHWAVSAMDALPELRWVHSDPVGVDRLPLTALAGRQVTVTNGRGTFSRAMAEWALLAMLSAVKRFPDFVRRSDAGEWDPAPTLGELVGARVLILGFGSVGQEIARLLVPFDVRVTAVHHRSRTVPRDDLAHVRLLRDPEDWQAEVPRADFVVLALPLTDATRNVVDRGFLGRMKPTSWLINLARGALVEEAALVDALDAGQIGGAVLDAFQVEPLPRDNPLWGRRNVVVLPHHTWSSDRVAHRAADLFVAQLSRWCSGLPLDHVVDVGAGY
jgi:phosphoglycerate dehydrogenase-like enzyme